MEHLIRQRLHFKGGKNKAASAAQSEISRRTNVCDDVAYNAKSMDMKQPTPLSKASQQRKEPKGTRLRQEWPTDPDQVELGMKEKLV